MPQLREGVQRPRPPPERRWRHLDTCQMQTLLICSIPRVSCPEHGVQQLPVPWAEARSRFTLLFEALAIDLMLCCPRRRAAEILGTTEDSLAGITRRAVARGLARKAQARMQGTHEVSEHLTIDEKYWHRRQCATVVGDSVRGVVEEMVEGNTTASATSALRALGEPILANVASVSMDLHGPFTAAAKSALGETRIVYDPFHVVKLANEAMEAVRRDEIAQHMQLKDHRGVAYLKKGRYSLLTAASRLKEKAQQRVDFISTWFEKTAEAYRLKELLRIYREAEDAATARNAAAESLNARIQAVRVKCRGHRNFQAFRDSVLFHLGGLDLYPGDQHSAKVSA